MKNFVLLIIGVFSLNFAFGQYEVTKYDALNGLMHENVLGVWQDKDSYIWIADEMGFSRINGDEIINYWPENGTAFDYTTVINITDSGFVFTSRNHRGYFDETNYFTTPTKI
jgi:ligand-binding sensor domain-containing protein